MKSRLPYLLLTGVLLLTAVLLTGTAAPTAEASSSAVAFDMVGSASENLTSFTDDTAIPFTSPGDGFNKFQRGISASIPFSVVDDSAGSFPPDTLGIIKTGNTDEFFGIVDTNNGDTSGRDVIATWVFDVVGASNLSLSIDMGAMGDFEASATTGDFFNWSYSIDGGATQTAFQSSVDESTDQTYSMESGTEVILNDPMLVNGVLLTNDLQTQTASLIGSGNQLTLVLTANTNGGSEAIAFQNLVVSGEQAPQDLAFDMVGSASQNLISFTDDPAIPFASAGDGFNKFQRGISTSIPFSVVDDSAGSFPPDTLGIIKSGNTDEFFGIVDTNNGDTSGRDVIATWVFDVVGASNLSLSIDMGAMGDFEASATTGDFFNWSYSIDGGATQTAFQSSVDESTDQTYSMESGTEVILNDPMLVNGVLLNNDLQTQNAALAGSGNQLALILTANTNGGSEAIAFQNLVVSGEPPPQDLAFDMVSSASQNLISFTDDPAIPFASAGDGFNKFQRSISASIPFSVVDDSAGSFPPDTLGIIKTGNTDEFFGIVDTNNGDTSGRDVVATWVFNISGASGLNLAINMGAMGDFEASATTGDFFNWSYSIDGGAAQTAFQSSVDESIDQTYTMESGTEVILNDPMLVNGVLLNNDLQTQNAALPGSGNQLTLILTANTNGGSEAIAFQDIVISGVGGENVPPTVVSTDPPDGANFVNVDSNIEILFSEGVTTTGDWFEIVCDSTNISAAASGGPAAYTLDPDSDLPSTTPCTVVILASQVASQGDPPLNMEQDYIFSFNTNAVCGDPATLIHEVQGPGAASPLVGQIVTVEGVIVGDFQEGDELNGFFIQEEDADFDGDTNTSEGIFVFEGGFVGPDVNEDDLVRVTGEVEEFKTLTQLKSLANVLVCSDSPGPFGPVDVTLPEASDGDLEKVEGMNINLTNTMSVAQNFFLGRYGQLSLSSDLDDRLFQPTNQVLPNTPESAALADYNARNLLFLDDGVDVSSCGDNPVPVPYLGPAPPNVLRGGDQVHNLTGVLDYGQINSAACGNSSTLAGRDYRLHPTQEPNFSNQNPRTAAPEDVGGNVKVVSFNVLNFFNGDGMGGGFPTSRGADTIDEFVRQRIKIFEAMKAIDGDVVGLMEIENDGFDQFSAIAELVKVMNEGPCYDTTLCDDIGYVGAGLGAGTYSYIDAGPGIVGDDAITVGFIYKPATVMPVGSPLVVDETAFTDPNGYNDQKNRPAIAQTFSDNNGGLFTPIVNHLKSKGSPCGAGDDDPEQASCNDTRTKAAEYLVNTIVPAVQAASGDPDVMIIGDLNAYAMEDPVRALNDGGFTNLPSDSSYSFTFDAMVGYLDYSMANSTMGSQVTGATAWQINTDEPAVIGYDQDFNPPGYYSPDSFRASDHDPIIVGLDVNGPPVCESASPSLESLWPVDHMFVSVSILGVTDPDSDPIGINIDAIWQDELVNGTGDGNTAPDGAGIGTDTAELRRERDGAGDSRAYHVFFTADDGNNNSCSGEVIVFVPKEQSKFGPRIDDGPLYDSTLP